MPPYQEKYHVGSKVRIASHAELEAFQTEWRYHHKLGADQLEHAARVCKVASVYYYHGGDVLYQLEGVLGIWHEVCLHNVGPDS